MRRRNGGMPTDRNTGKAVGNGRIGSCPTDATHEGRSRRAVRKSAAMLAPERLRKQSLRHSDPVESCQPPFRIGTNDIQTVPGNCQANRRLEAQPLGVGGAPALRQSFSSVSSSASVNTVRSAYTRNGLSASPFDRDRSKSAGTSPASFEDYPPKLSGSGMARALAPSVVRKCLSCKKTARRSLVASS
jgi:hypothetical protein